MADYSKQLDWFNPRLHAAPVHLIGLGGIGSALLLPLIKLGITDLTLYDDDVLEEGNIPSQLIYADSDIGKPKVVAAAEFAARYGVMVKTVQTRVDDSAHFEDIVISGVDSMASRSAIWKAVSYNPEVSVYIDGRVGGQQVTYLTAIPTDTDSMDLYEATLFSDDQAEELPCSARAIIHPVTVLAGLIVHELSNFLRAGKTPVPELVFDMPTHTVLINQPSQPKEIAI